MNENIKIICSAIFSIYDIDENQKKKIEEKIATLWEDELKNILKSLITYKENDSKLKTELREKLQVKLINIKEIKERKQAFNEAESLINNI